MSAVTSLPGAFVWRRLHSLMGLWLVLFLIEHLITNSQAPLLLGENGKGFVQMVNFLHHLPYLHVIEFTLLGIPILIHGAWGVKYLFTAKYNSGSSDGSTPSLKYGRNHAYTWQRITSWILLFLLAFHIVKFRFLSYPDSVNEGSHPTYFAPVSIDNGLYAVADRVNADIYSSEEIEKLQSNVDNFASESLLEVAKELREEKSDRFDPQKKLVLDSAQNTEEKIRFSKALSAKHLKENEVIVAADNFGTISLFLVRDTFKNPYYVALYTVFVLSACFHAFNGFWTFLITWGWILKMSSQRTMVKVSIALMMVIAFLGLMSIWGTYWFNYKL